MDIKRNLVNPEWRPEIPSDYLKINNIQPTRIFKHFDSKEHIDVYELVTMQELGKTWYGPLSNWRQVKVISTTDINKVKEWAECYNCTIPKTYTVCVRKQ